MPTTKKDSGPTVSARVDEANGTVSIGVEHEGRFLTVAQKNLGSAVASSVSLDGSDDSDDDGKEG